MGCLFQDPEDGGLGESLRRQAPANHPQCTLWKLADPQQREVPTLGDPVPRFARPPAGAEDATRTRFRSCLWAGAPGPGTQGAPSFLDADGHGDKTQRGKETCLLTMWHRSRYRGF